MPRNDWPLGFIRTLADELLALLQIRKKGPILLGVIYWGSSLRLTFEDIAFNMFEAVFKFSILLQLCFHSCNRAADRTVLV